MTNSNPHNVVKPEMSDKQVQTIASDLNKFTSSQNQSK